MKIGDIKNIKAAKKYTEDTVNKVAVYDFHTVKPVDDELLFKLSKTKAILTVEEHSVIGGLGSAVSDYYSDKKNHPCVYKIGLPDEYPHGAGHETLLKDFGLDEQGIYNKIRSIVENKKL